MRSKTRKGSTFLAVWLIAGCLLRIQPPAKASSVQDKNVPPHAIELAALGKSQKKMNAAIVKGVRIFQSLRCPALAIRANPHAPVPNAPNDSIQRAAEIVEELAATSAQAVAFQTCNPLVRVVRFRNASHRVVGSNQADAHSERNAFVPKLR